MQGLHELQLIQYDMSFVSRTKATAAQGQRTGRFTDALVLERNGECLGQARGACLRTNTLMRVWESVFPSVATFPFRGAVRMVINCYNAKDCWSGWVPLNVEVETYAQLH
jgi:hypothetical protein